MVERKGLHHGLFLTFEGIEGCGKSTQCGYLAQALRREGFSVQETREPGGTPFAERIRELLLAQATSETDRITPYAEACLLLAARSQHVRHVIDPALRRGAIVICDRFSDSTLAYQGYGRGIAVQDLQHMDRHATCGHTPDLTILLDLPPGRSLERRRRGSVQNRIDRESLAFHKRVRKGFLALAAREPQRIRIIDGASDPERIARDVLDLVRPLLPSLASSRRRKRSTPFHPVRSQ